MGNLYIRIYLCVSDLSSLCPLWCNIAHSHLSCVNLICLELGQGMTDKTSYAGKQGKAGELGLLIGKCTV